MRILCALLLFAAAQALAQSYPAKTVRIVVPASPGGASDLIARMVATPLTETFGQPVVVENRVTSGGIIGTQQVAESPADGHTLLVTFDTFAINPFVFKGLRWDPQARFRAGDADLPLPAGAARESGARRAHARRVRGARQGERRAAQLRHRRPGLLEPARVRALQGCRRHRDDPGALQGRGPGDPGPALGPGAGDARAGRRLDPCST